MFSRKRVNPVINTIKKSMSVFLHIKSGFVPELSQPTKSMSKYGPN